MFDTDHQIDRRQFALAAATTAAAFAMPSQLVASDETSRSLQVLRFHQVLIDAQV